MVQQNESALQIWSTQESQLAASTPPVEHKPCAQAAEAVHTPATQLWPDKQAVQADPPVPHAEAVVPVWQVPLESRHPVHALVTQTPPVHAWFAPHTAQVWPPAPHAAFAWPVWHTPLASTQPPQALPCKSMLTFAEATPFAMTSSEYVPEAKPDGTVTWVLTVALPVCTPMVEWLKVRA